MKVVVLEFYAAVTLVDCAKKSRNAALNAQYSSRDTTLPAYRYLEWLFLNEYSLVYTESMHKPTLSDSF